MTSTIPYLGCTTCHQPIHPRHDHPHDYHGSLLAFANGDPCTACNQVHHMTTITVAWYPRSAA